MDMEVLNDDEVNDTHGNDEHGTGTKAATSTRIMQLQAAVSKIVQQLVEHYSQAVHEHSSSMPSLTDSTRTNMSSLSERTMKKRIMLLEDSNTDTNAVSTLSPAAGGGAMQDDEDSLLTPVLQHLLDRLVLLSSSSSSQGLFDGTANQTQQSVTRIVAAASLVKTYRDQIRPIVFGVSQRCITKLYQQPATTPGQGVVSRAVVLEQYERLVRHYYCRWKQQHHAGTTSRHYPAVVSESSSSSSSSLSAAAGGCWETLQLVASDITALTATIDSSSNGNDQQLQLLLGTLWSLVHSMLQLLSSIRLDNDDITGITEKSHHETYQSAMRRCVCSLLALPCQSHTNGLDLRQLVDSQLLVALENSLTVSGQHAYWAYPPTPPMATTRARGHESSNNNDDVYDQTMDWNKFVSHASIMVWRNQENDAESLVSKIWKQLLLLLPSSSNLDETTPSRIPACSAHDNDNKNTIQRMVLAQLGWVEMAMALGAHFFGKDVQLLDRNDDEAATTRLLRHRLHLGHLVAVDAEKEQDERDQDALLKPYQKIPSRLHAVLAFVSLLNDDKQHDDDYNTPIAPSISPHVAEALFLKMVPICYELLNASSDVAIGKGAVLALGLWNVLVSSRQKAIMMQPQHSVALNSSDSIHKHSSTVQQQQQVALDNLLLALDTVIRSCRDGCTLALVGLAQRALLLHHDKTWQHVRHGQATHQWILLLDKVRHNPSDPRLVWGILVTLIPLLYDHAVVAGMADASSKPPNTELRTATTASAQQIKNNAMIELGRPGLTVLLPLVRLLNKNDNILALHDEPISAVPFLALVALSNLLVAAHPIMPRHAQTILCELLACLGHPWYDDDSNRMMEKQHTDKDDSVRCRILLHVTAMAVLICGPKADIFLVRLTQDPCYNDGLKDSIHEVQENVSRLRLPQQGNLEYDRQFCVSSI